MIRRSDKNRKKKFEIFISTYKQVSVSVKISRSRIINPD